MHQDNREEKNLELRKYRVITELTVLFKLRILFKEIHLGGLLKGETIAPREFVMSLLELLEDHGKINEFCSIVTGEKDFDYRNEQAGTVLWVIHDFFTEWWWQMPRSWRQWVENQSRMLLTPILAPIASILKASIQQTSSTANE